jgi:hypothetical protein
MSKAVARRTTVGSPERQQIADQVLAGMSGGLSTFKACEAAQTPHSTFLLWVSQDSLLADRYARAREDLIEHMAAETLAIADAPVGSTEHGTTDSGAVAKQRLQVDTRKWLLSKLAPKKYGDKVTLSGDAENPLTVEKIQRVIIGADGK